MGLVMKSRACGKHMLLLPYPLAGGSEAGGSGYWADGPCRDDSLCPNERSGTCLAGIAAGSGKRVAGDSGRGAQEAWLASPMPPPQMGNCGGCHPPVAHAIAGLSGTAPAQVRYRPHTPAQVVWA